MTWVALDDSAAPPFWQRRRREADRTKAEWAKTALLVTDAINATVAYWARGLLLRAGLILDELDEHLVRMVVPADSTLTIAQECAVLGTLGDRWKEDREERLSEIYGLLGELWPQVEQFGLGDRTDAVINETYDLAGQELNRQAIEAANDEAERRGAPRGRPLFYVPFNPFAGLGR